MSLKRLLAISLSVMSILAAWIVFHAMTHPRERYVHLMTGHGQFQWRLVDGKWQLVHGLIAEDGVTGVKGTISDLPKTAGGTTGAPLEFNYEMSPSGLYVNGVRLQPTPYRPIYLLKKGGRVELVDLPYLELAQITPDFMRGNYEDSEFWNAKIRPLTHPSEVGLINPIVRVKLGGGGPHRGGIDTQFILHTVTTYDTRGFRIGPSTKTHRRVDQATALVSVYDFKIRVFQSDDEETLPRSKAECDIERKRFKSLPLCADVIPTGIWLEGQQIPAGHLAVLQSNGTLKMHKITREELIELDRCFGNYDWTKSKELVNCIVPLLDESGLARYMELVSEQTLR